MRYETSTTTPAEPARLWAVLSDIEKWPDWIEVYEEVRLAETGPLTLGARAHVKQRGLAGGDWTVTELEEGRVFEWESRQPGVRLVGRHAVSAEPDGGSRLHLSFEMTGALAGLMSLLLARKVRRYVDLESACLAAVAAEPSTA
jgi:ribosome-associated toxin RatA of RatAB toxin-antitoxin module